MPAIWEERSVLFAIQCSFRRYLFQSGQPGGRWPLTHPPPAPEHRARYRLRPLLLSPPFLAQGDTSENMGMQRHDFSKFLRSCSCIEDDAWGREALRGAAACARGGGGLQWGRLDQRVCLRSVRHGLLRQ